MPLRHKLHDVIHDFLLGAHVDAAGRLVEDQQPRLGRQPARQQHLLLVAARERPDGRLDAGGLDAQPLDVVGGQLLLALQEARARCPGAPATPESCSRAPTAAGSRPRACGLPNRSRCPARWRRADWKSRPACHRLRRRRRRAWSAPNSRRAVSVRPEPSRPARPSSSPRCSSRSTGASTPLRAIARARRNSSPRTAASPARPQPLPGLRPARRSSCSPARAATARRRCTRPRARRCASP